MVSRPTLQLRGPASPPPPSCGEREVHVRPSCWDEMDGARALPGMGSGGMDFARLTGMALAVPWTERYCDFRAGSWGRGG